jgi:hypothetical protein
MPTPIAAATGAAPIVDEHEEEEEAQPGSSSSSIPMFSSAMNGDGTDASVAVVIGDSGVGGKSNAQWPFIIPIYPFFIHLFNSSMATLFLFISSYCNKQFLFYSFSHI